MKYNQALKNRYDRQDVDPISLADIDESNEWLLGSMMDVDEDAADERVFGDDENEELTWGAVASAAGVGEPIKQTRSQSQAKGKKASSSRAKGKQPITNIEELANFDSDELEEDDEGYKSNNEGGESPELAASESDSDF